MATVCLFFQQKEVKKQLLVLVVTEKVKNQREKKNKIPVKEDKRLGANFSPWLHFSGHLVIASL